MARWAPVLDEPPFSAFPGGSVAWGLRLGLLFASSVCKSAL